GKRAVGDVDVIPRRDFLDPRAHVANELAAMLFSVGVARALDVGEVATERKLHVHVDLEIARQQESKIGARGASLGARLLVVVDALEKSGESENVLRHALAPLAARGRI